MKVTRRSLLLAGTAATAAWRLPAQAQARPLTPEQFGAKGDGVTNDSAALARLADAVNRQGGGEILFRRATYLVGVQTRTRGDAVFAFEPATILEFSGCTRPLRLRGSGATIKCAPGLRYGTFDRASGEATSNAMPYLGRGEVATPYRFMIKAENCLAAVEISDLELDGSLDQLRIGGPYGDTGHQIPAIGLGLINNRGPERLARIHSHHHGQDGLLIDGADGPRPAGASGVIEQVRCDYNGRQGCSIVGGQDYAFEACRFNQTGRSAVASSPGAGVDIEAEAGKKVRRLRFADCEFADNFGQGMVADSGDSEGATFARCTFVGSTNWAIWPNKPRFRFDQCRFVGPVVRAHGDQDPQRATQFHDCMFRDDPALSPSGKIYGGENRDRPIADLPENLNVLFNRCQFLLTHDSVLPWTTDLTYADCVMRQAATRESYPRGRFKGRTTIDGKAAIAGSRIEGEVVLNGRRLGPGRV